MARMLIYTYSIYFFFSVYGDHRDLHVLTHSFPTRRSSDLHGPVGERPGPTAALADFAGDPAEMMQAAPHADRDQGRQQGKGQIDGRGNPHLAGDRKSTRLNSSH